MLQSIRNEHMRNRHVASRNIPTGYVSNADEILLEEHRGSDVLEGKNLIAELYRARNKRGVKL